MNMHFQGRSSKVRKYLVTSPDGTRHLRQPRLASYLMRIFWKLWTSRYSSEPNTRPTPRKCLFPDLKLRFVIYSAVSRRPTAFTPYSRTIWSTSSKSRSTWTEIPSENSSFTSTVWSTNWARTVGALHCPESTIWGTWGHLGMNEWFRIYSSRR